MMVNEIPRRPKTRGMSPLIYWFRIDLRLTDAPALVHAIQVAQRDGQTLLPVFCHAPPETTRRGFARVAASLMWPNRCASMIPMAATGDCGWIRFDGSADQVH